MSTPPRTHIPNFDGRVPGEAGQHDVFIPGGRLPKLGFAVFSFALLLFGLWDISQPASRLFFGERANARVVSILRESPGEAPEKIRIKREISEGDYAFDTVFRLFVEVTDAEGNLDIFELGVGSRSVPYAKVNDDFEVIYFPDGEYAFGLWHHRTWAIGVTFILMGLVFVSVSLYLLWMVGKPIVIDPEDPQEIEKERAILAAEADTSTNKALETSN